MKTTLVLIITAIAGMSFAGPSDSAAFAIRAAREAATRNEEASNRIALVRSTETNNGAQQQSARQTQRCCSTR